MNRASQVLRLGTVLFVMAFLSPWTASRAHAEDPGPDQAQEWKDAAPQQAAIYSPDPEQDTYLPINHTHQLVADALDLDCYRVGETWYPYWDDVTSGETESDWHIVWMLMGDSEGSLIDPYGSVATYKAPDYKGEGGNDVRDMTIMAFCEDYNRGDDTFGWDDTNAGYHESVLKVWQVTVTAIQYGSESGCYDGTSVGTWRGGSHLRWVCHNDPAGCAKYGANTQVTGLIPEGPGVTTGYTWYQQWCGHQRHKVLGSNEWKNDKTAATWTTEIPIPGGGTYWCMDEDSRHPNTTGQDCRMIFLRDVPGFECKADNDNYIPAPHNWRVADCDLEFRNWVELAGQRVSNLYESWQCKFTLVEDNLTWAVDGSHIPAQ